ncbi:protein EMSY-LIKE 1-like isoform X3 [Amaranthus tricolor]|uniref:protein EMSY-LIKE 1-like isoform X3 n=1 Tax=Amaranthus tricolor TaxID=29722 RepID=UPI002586CE15|nr:protein EMSY-LIKE 1-like isoform X3 [Amaranthus tricolor]
MLGSGTFHRVQVDMQEQIHHLEKEAYYAVLLAFKAQSHALTWDKESLMTELRKELRVSVDEHREVLSRVNNAEVICRIMEWRNGGGHQAMITSHPTNDVSSLTYASRKKQRTIQSFPTHGAPPSAGAISSRPRGGKTRQFPYNDHALHGTIMSGSGEDLVGKKIMIRWPDDNHFCEALISRYNPSDMPFEDFRWVNEETVLSDRGGPREKRSLNHATLPGIVRKQCNSEIQNDTRNVTDDIEILHTDTLIKKVEKVVVAPNPDCFEIEKAKQMLKEHEQALIDAISRLSRISDADINGNPLHRISDGDCDNN